MKTLEVDDKILKFNEDEHTYTLDGNEIPGVTSVTGIIDKSQPIKWWAVNEARDYINDEMEPGREYDEAEISELADGARTAHLSTSNRATTIGTLVHQYAEDYFEYLSGDAEEPDFPENEEAQEAAIEFLDWMENHDVKALETEQMVFHPWQRFAGTYDLKANIDGDTLIIDFKTSSGIYDEMLAQVTAYYVAEQYRIDVDNDDELDGIGLIRFPKDTGEFETHICTDQDELDRHFDGFKGCRTVYEWQQNN